MIIKACSVRKQKRNWSLKRNGSNRGENVCGTWSVGTLHRTASRLVNCFFYIRINEFEVIRMTYVIEKSHQTLNILIFCLKSKWVLNKSLVSRTKRTTMNPNLFEIWEKTKTKMNAKMNSKHVFCSCGQYYCIFLLFFHILWRQITVCSNYFCTRE